MSEPPEPLESLRRGVPAVVHYLHKDPQGPVVSGGLKTPWGAPCWGLAGGRFRVACWPGRPTVKGLHVTDLAEVVNCPRCRASKAFLALPEAQRGRAAPVAASG